MTDRWLPEPSAAPFFGTERRHDDVEESLRALVARLGAELKVSREARRWRYEVMAALLNDGAPVPPDPDYLHEMLVSPVECEAIRWAMSWIENDPCGPGGPGDEHLWRALRAVVQRLPGGTP